MVTRAYRCQVCGYRWQERQRIADPLLTVCPVTSCRAPAVARTYEHEQTDSGSTSVMPAVLQSSRDSRYVDGQRRLRREFVGRERDGSETVYRSLGEAWRGELERAQEQTWLPPRLQARLAQENVRHLARMGYVPGTRSSDHAAAIEEAPQR